MNAPDLFGTVRPLLHLAGSIVIAAGLLKFAGVRIPISGAGLELAVAGFLLRNI